MEASDKRYQYVLFAAEPYENIAFKVPNEVVVAPSSRTKEKQEEPRTFSHWWGWVEGTRWSPAC